MIIVINIKKNKVKKKKNGYEIRTNVFFHKNARRNSRTAHKR